MDDAKANSPDEPRAPSIRDVLSSLERADQDQQRRAAHSAQPVGAVAAHQAAAHQAQAPSLPPGRSVPLFGPDPARAGDPFVSRLATALADLNPHHAPPVMAPSAAPGPMAFAHPPAVPVPPAPRPQRIGAPSGVQASPPGAPQSDSLAMRLSRLRPTPAARQDSLASRIAALRAGTSRRRATLGWPTSLLSAFAVGFFVPLGLGAIAVVVLSPSRSAPDRAPKPVSDVRWVLAPPAQAAHSGSFIETSVQVAAETTRLSVPEMTTVRLGEPAPVRVILEAPQGVPEGARVVVRNVPENAGLFPAIPLAEPGHWEVAADALDRLMLTFYARPAAAPALRLDLRDARGVVLASARTEVLVEDVLASPPPVAVAEEPQPLRDDRAVAAIDLPPPTAARTAARSAAASARAKADAARREAKQSAVAARAERAVRPPARPPSSDPRVAAAPAAIASGPPALLQPSGTVASTYPPTPPALFSGNGGGSDVAGTKPWDMPWARAALGFSQN